MLTAATACAAHDQPGGRWWRIVDEKGQLLGRVHETVASKGDGRTIVTEREMRFTVGGHSPTHLVSRNTRLENAAGDVIGLTSENRSLHDRSTISATIFGNSAVIVQSRHGASRSTRLTLPAGVRFDGGEAVLSREATDRSFNQFDLAGLVTERVVLERNGEERWRDKTFSRIIRKTYDGDELRSVSVILVDD